ncbi:molybdopterin oxidoreductase family protein [Parendozoicomonas sp. Alg238-R29]|uniref:molybdopterin oxidoreductase family protein n=1 Tax=Parendozoicomonas sp. Alg238-R29 TaxID=2993446 RepID=UPI00248DF3E8|nr:molybdopterin oxidoreductase family protein [Parendozoicomonas sp. Alg238-R29]
MPDSVLPEQIHYRTCNLCEAVCGIKITYTGTEIHSIKGDKEDPFSRGHICPKAIALKDLYQDSDRIRKPLERTSDGWKEISWDEALDKAAEGIRRVQKAHGNNAMATYLGNPNVHNTGSLLMGRHFFNAVRTRNRFSATSVDQLPHHIVSWKLFGHQLKIPVPDIDRTEHMMIIGGNPLASNGSVMTVPDVKKRLQDIQKRGGKVIVIDPRKTETAQIADEHHFIKPGTDAFLLLAIINTLFSEQLIDTAHLTSHLKGFQKIKNYVGGWTPERAADITGISAASIKQLAIEFGKAEKPVCYGRMGVSVQEFGLLCQYLIMVINIATGRLDAEGGLMFTKPAADLLKQTGRGHLGKGFSRVRNLPEFNGEFPVSALAEEILVEGDGQIKGLVTVAGNPALSTPNGTQLEKGLEGLEFMVAIDFYLNETTKHANIILPPVSPLEREHYDVIFNMLAVRNTARYSPALFEKAPGEKHDWQIYQELEKRLHPPRNLQGKITNKLLKSLGPDGVLDMLLKTGPYGMLRNPLKGLSRKRLQKQVHGVDLGPLTPCLPETLFTKDKLIHLEPEFFFKDLERLESSANSQSDKLLLIGRRDVRTNNSWLHNSRRLVKGKNRCTAHLHSDDAQRLGVTNGQQIEVSSRTGTVVIEAEVTDTIMQGVVSIPHGWGHNRKGMRMAIASDHAGQSVNDLTDDQAIDSLSGNAALNGVPVTLTPIEKQQESDQLKTASV